MAINMHYGTFKQRSYPIYTADSPFDLLSLEPTEQGNRMFNSDPGFFGYEAWGTVAHNVATGEDSRYLRNVEAIINQIDATIDVETQGYVIDNAVTGFIPDVPSAIQNLPESMITMEATQLDFAPINVYVAGSIQGQLDLGTVAKRGAAVAAMLQKLQAIRPVNLIYVKGNGGSDAGTFGTVQIPSRPMNLSQVSYMVCNGAFFRWTIYALTRWNKKGVPFDPIFEAHSCNAQSEALARDTITFLGGDPEHDIYVPPLHANDRFLKQPVQWIESILNKYRVKVRG